MGMRQWLQEISLPVYILVSLFAISSWIDLNGLWVQLPLFVKELPEAWNLPAYLTIIIQIANIGPLAYTLGNKYCPRLINEPPIVYVIIIIGAVSCIVLALFWRVTTIIGGTLHSTVLLTMTGMLALVDCTSSVVFLPYMTLFKPQYMTALYIGEGLSGLVPGVLGLIQGAGGNPVCVNQTTINTTTNQTSYATIAVYSPPLFSVETYFFCLLAIVIVSGSAFTVLHFSSFCKKEQIQVNLYDDVHTQHHKKKHTHRVEIAEGHNSLISPQRKSFYSNYGSTETDSSSYDENFKTDLLTEVSSDIQYRQESMTLQSYIFLYGMIMWLNSLTNGMMPSVQTYTMMPYGPTAYQMAVILGIFSNPLASFSALFIRCKSKWPVGMVVSLGTLCAAYNIYLAVMSPYPPMLNEATGQIIAVLTWMTMTASFSFAKVTIASILRMQGRKALLWCGIFTQLGAFIGAIISFILVTVLKVFHSKEACS